MLVISQFNTLTTNNQQFKRDDPNQSMSKPISNLSSGPSSTNLYSRVGTPEIPSIKEIRVANLPISKNLNSFEKSLSSLLTSISKYDPQSSDAEDLLGIEHELEKSVEDIISHQQSGLKINSLETKSSKIDSNCKQLLLGLNECRNQLKSLPNLEEVQQEQKSMQRNKIPADELLQYAMKLAKFTTAPPTFDSAAIGPNNFIWPAEDSLRRGMLAIASLNEAELTGKSPIKTQIQDESKLQDEILNGSSPQNVRRGSFGGSYGGDDNGGDDGVIEELDLFDPDDE
ncbi:Mediator of RNA polymerase II transcription subunit 4 [Wickerhamomyces ciferrii]|uniref:Mediator of RNA polymerase II transcription subunit 4 n=1 Tax=Wickerhamomyces ciferrii (strain ATCC 14091 / BCRC 22168 / CBS 111 / JCM 3599 / NBRC 0793 / NRRL Y-1031 F-60-10) TaxID=1206466 RepID=K0KLB7_WICCF|nr:Mediator of RNA polymerase II transcription subunit 4 [Wickerhamomyces ciferrii]CCH41908.1 Mediator of RNA polymerase II transcription subunit 4 [Wickerhamomyces ciferrii]